MRKSSPGGEDLGEGGRQTNIRRRKVVSPLRFATAVQNSLPSAKLVKTFAPSQLCVFALKIFRVDAV
jgi:hypothetical protein